MYVVVLVFMHTAGMAIYLQMLVFLFHVSPFPYVTAFGNSAQLVLI